MRFLDFDYFARFICCNLVVKYWELQVSASNIEQVQKTSPPTKQHLYSHRPPIRKTIKIRRTRHAAHRWRSRDELISDVFLWTPSHGRAKAGRPTRTYIQLLCVDSPEDLPKAMDDREVWRERVRNICADSAISWRWLQGYEINLILKVSVIFSCCSI